MDDPHVELPMPVVLADLKRGLTERAHRLVNEILAVELYLAAGWRLREIRPGRQLTDAEWRVARAWMREELGAQASQ